MSYDLFFRARGERSPSEKELRAYFDGHHRYQLEGDQAWYQNEDTGVYFLFEFGNQGGEGDEVSDLLPISFNINYFRPHVFGLEAESELSRFIAQFELLVSDPQMSGMGDGEYAAEGFLSGWNAGNELGYSVYLREQKGQRILHLPTETIEQVWRWNYGRETFYERLGQDLFVPKIMFAEHEGRLKLAAAWPDAIPVVLPEVDLLILGRDALAPRRLFRKKPDYVVVNFDDIRKEISTFPRGDGAWPHLTLSYEVPPADLQALFRRQPSFSGKLSIASPDSVLNSELFPS